MSFLDQIVAEAKQVNKAKQPAQYVFKRPAERTQNEKLAPPSKNKTPEMRVAVNDPVTVSESLPPITTGENKRIVSHGMNSKEKLAVVLDRLFGIREEKSVPLEPLISDVETCRDAVDYLMQFTLLAIDCEWITVTQSNSEQIMEVENARNGAEETIKSADFQLCLVQIATPEKKAFLFDILVGGTELFTTGNLKSLLENTNITKVFHDCRWDSYVLWKSGGIQLNRVFDTQIAYCIFERVKGRKTPLPISYQKLLLKFALGAKNEAKEEIQLAMDSDANFWKIRPLTQLMIDYASYDVIPLSTVYNQINAAIFTQKSIDNIFKFSQSYVELHKAKSLEEMSKYLLGLELEKKEKTWFPKYHVSTWDKELAAYLLTEDALQSLMK